MVMVVVLFTLSVLQVLIDGKEMNSNEREIEKIDVLFERERDEEEK
jgi:hypothetical protein